MRAAVVGVARALLAPVRQATDGYRVRLEAQVAALRAQVWQVLLSIAVWALRLFLVAVQACCVGIAALLFALVTYVLLYMATVPQVTHSFPLTFQYPHQDGVPALRNSAILPADVAAAYSDQRGLSGGVALIAGALPPAYATDPTDFPTPRATPSGQDPPVTSTALARFQAEP
ncbi:hypothetical protein FNF27_03294 [Cafeteria roenbergensis]|uniref:Uncharacterized protein n=2 Tax=Cafeteria roenbergensis TaxID=33653 RepID=A0A5A8EBR3_CAFRO|nr:hypothetical protein FNF27_03294 [Cafeteria roenbergensis]